MALRLICLVFSQYNTILLRGAEKQLLRPVVLLMGRRCHPVITQDNSSLILCHLRSRPKFPVNHCSKFNIQLHSALFPSITILQNDSNSVDLNPPTDPVSLPEPSFRVSLVTSPPSLRCTRPARPARPSLARASGNIGNNGQPGRGP